MKRNYRKNIWKIRMTAVFVAAQYVSGVGVAADHRAPGHLPKTESAGPSSGALNLSRIPWEGGPAYYQAFLEAAGRGWTSDNFFPVGVWFEGVYDQGNIDKDKELGINTYVALTKSSDFSLIRANGMSVILQDEIMSGYGTETVGYNLGDEVDMLYGPAKGYQIMATQRAARPDDSRMRYANFGKGVLFWESDQEAGAFVNNYTDVISSDLYWYTDPNVCGSPSEGPSRDIPAEECRRAANYGWTVDRMRSLDAQDGRRQPVWAFVENGHPAGENDAPAITPDQLAGAVMSSLIHEARGIIYFNHSFGGPCQGQHNFRETCYQDIRERAGKVNGQIRELAPVLNTQSYQHTFNVSLDTMLKERDGAFYIFAMLKRSSSPGDYLFRFPEGMKGKRVEVMFENRSIPINGSVFTDHFPEEYSYHVYRMTR